MRCGSIDTDCTGRQTWRNLETWNFWRTFSAGDRSWQLSQLQALLVTDGKFHAWDPCLCKPTARPALWSLFIVCYSHETWRSHPIPLSGQKLRRVHLLYSNASQLNARIVYSTQETASGKGEDGSTRWSNETKNIRPLSDALSCTSQV